MLNTMQKALIKSTIPALEIHGETIIRHFYDIMLNEWPEIRPLFNMTHISSGIQNKAMAQAVVKYAQHIDDLAALQSLLARVSNKHVTLQIQREYYPIVGSYLLRAMREVLGDDIATDAVLMAWQAAYQQLANRLSETEARAYDAMASAPGGWYGGRAFKLINKVPESVIITSFYFAPIDGKPVIDFIPGQYICIRLRINNEETQRHYSLSAAPNGKSYRISVKREQHGHASLYLHDQLNEGDVVTLFPPAGDFQLIDNHKPLVLISGGIGITPTLAMLEATMGSNRQVIFINYARTAEVQAFRQCVEAFKNQHPLLETHWVLEEPNSGYAEAFGRPNEQQLAVWLPDHRDVEAYFLGSTPFMAYMKRTLHTLGVPENQLHYEFFGPQEALD